MTDAPEWIWVDETAIATDDEGSHITRDPEGPHTEYIRADIAAAAVAAMREACAAVADRHMAAVDINEPLWHEGQDWACSHIATAIRAMEAPK